ncbi:MAG: HAMP domain-containing sensor histidine kinase [Candidatus Altiarchaeota archaeon]
MVHEAFKTPQDNTSPTQQKGLPGVWDVENAFKEYTSASALSTASKDILKHVVDDLGLKRAGLYFFNPEEKTLESRFELKGKRLSSPPGKATMPLDAEGDAMAHTAREALAGNTEAHHFKDARRDPRLSRGYIEFQEFATVPLFDDKQKLVGVIWADNEDKKEITGEQLFGLNLLSKLGGAMIRGAQVKDYHDNLLYAVTAHANRLKLDDTIEDIMEAALKVSGADKVDIRLRNVHTLHDIDIYMKGFSGKEQESLDRYIAEVRKKGETRPLIRELLEKKDVEVINVKDEVAKGKESRVDPELMRDIDMEDGVIYNIPIELKGEDIVAMRVYYKDPEKAKHANIDRLRALTNVTASAIINARTHETVKKMAAGAIHNIGNDTNIIISSAEDLAEMFAGNDEAIDVITDILARATTMKDAVEAYKLNAWFREKGRIDILKKSVNVGEVVGISVSGHRQLAAVRGVQLEFDQQLEKSRIDVPADRSKLMQAVDNMVNNAIKFTAAKKFPEGEKGRVTAGVREVERDGKKYVEIYVKDNGIGIPESDRAKVTEEFFRGQHGVQDGTGLGLWSVSSIVKAHSGELKIESEEGAGTTVTVILPK